MWTFKKEAKLMILMPIAMIGLSILVAFLLPPLLHKQKNSGNNKESMEYKTLLEKIIFPEAYEIGNHYDKELKITAIGYNLKIKYPSKKVLEFYDNKFNELGWEKYPSHLGESDRNWMDFIDGTRKGEPLVHQLGGYWHDKEKNKMATLVLRYHSIFSTNDEKLYAEEPNTDVLDVVVNISPFIDLSEISKEDSIQE
ncbi:MAG: hypothetical protein ACXACY_19745 [Candidatus Hodarchaeales archaeon]|jgi:hypothetical protein